MQNFRNAYKTLKSYKVAKQIIQEIKPNIIIGTGGYICGPVFSAGFKYKIPTICVFFQLSLFHQASNLQKYFP